MKRLIKSFLKNKNLIPVILLGLIPIIWFWGKGNILINGVDTNFPLNPLLWFSRRFYVWNNVLNAGGDFSASSAGLFFHFIQVVPYLLGFKLQTVELISLLFWFFLIVYSAYFLAKIILPKNFLSQIIFTVFYSFNIYLFNAWENVKVTNLSLMAGIPLALGTLILLDKREITRKIGFLLAAVSGIILSGTGINPSYFISFFLIVFIYFIVGVCLSRGDKFKRLLNFVLLISIIVLVNIFWILPTLNYVIKGVPLTGSIDKIGFTSWIDSLSENNSLFNVIRLQGAWDWYSTDLVTGLPLYIPYALNYFFRLPFIVFSLIPPFLAILSLIFRKKTNTYLYLSFSLMFVIGVFLGAGTHQPTGVLFRFLINHLPFFSLFRSPWYIFTPLVTLAYAGLIGLLFDHVYEILPVKKQKVGKLLLGFFGITILIGNLLYCYPLITGKIFRPGRPDSFYVSFPEYTFNAAQWLKEDGGGGRIISYPDDEIENFKWGYRGIESILQLVANKEVLFSSLNTPNSPVGRMVKEFYLTLKKGESNSAMNIAQKLNATFVFQKNDQNSLSPSILNIMANANSINKFGEWTFHKLPVKETQSKIFSSSNLTFAYPYDKGEVALSLLDFTRQIVNPNDSEVKKIAGIDESAASVIIAGNSQEEAFNKFINTPSELANRLLTRDFSKVEFTFEVFKKGNYIPMLEKYRLEDFGLATNGNLKVGLDDLDILLSVEKTDDSYVYYRPIVLSKGIHKLVLSLKDENLIIGGDFENGEIFKRGGYGEGNVEYEIKEDESGKYLAITNYDRAEASADFNVTGFNPYMPYYVSVRYRQIYGNNGLVVPEQNTSTTLIKAQNERLPNYPEWGKIGFYYDPVKTESEMKIFLISPFTTDPLGTRMYYDNLSVKRVFTNNFMFIEESSNIINSAVVDYHQISPVEYQGTVMGGAGAHTLIFAENFSTDWQIKLFNKNGREIKTDTKHFSVNLYANAWYLENMTDEYQFKIFYRPELLHRFGFAVSLTTLLSALAFFLFHKIKRKI